MSPSHIAAAKGLRAGRCLRPNCHGRYHSDDDADEARCHLCGRTVAQALREGQLVAHVEPESTRKTKYSS